MAAVDRDQAAYPPQRGQHSLLGLIQENGGTDLFNPETMAFGPCPGMEQPVGSVRRAAGFAMIDSLSMN